MRARYYSPVQGRFITRDPYEGLLNNLLPLIDIRMRSIILFYIKTRVGKFIPILVIAGISFAAGAIYDAYQQTNGFTNFCKFDILEMLTWGVGGAGAATALTIMAVTGVGFVGMGLQGVALGLYELGITASLSTSMFLAGTSAVGLSSTAMAWLFTSQIQVFFHTGVSWHLGLETKDNMNIIHVGNQDPQYGIHIAFGAVKPFMADMHIYLQEDFPFFRFWRP